MAVHARFAIALYAQGISQDRATTDAGTRWLGATARNTARLRLHVDPRLVLIHVVVVSVQRLSLGVGLL